MSKGMPHARRSPVFRIGLALAIGGFGCADPAAESGASADGVTLRTAAEATGRLFGAALNSLYFGSDAIYTQLAGSEFGYVTPEWEMKWAPTEPSPGAFNWGPADEVVTFAAEHGMAVKGHTLVWHRALPAWVSSLATADDLRLAMLNHVAAVAGHYAGRIKAWDVVNEAIDDNAPFALRNTVFLQKLGEGYIGEAFRAARVADPDALLFYNEANMEGSTGKLEATVALVERLLAAGVPIDGVGFQMHVAADNAPTATALSAALARFTDLGLWVSFSELDVRLWTLIAGLPLCFELQRARYHDLVAVCVGNPKCMSVTTWGVTDAHTWLDDQSLWSLIGDGRHHPLLFNADGSKKPAYYGTLAALLGR